MQSMAIREAGTSIKLFQLKPTVRVSTLGSRAEGNGGEEKCKAETHQKEANDIEADKVKLDTLPQSAWNLLWKLLFKLLPALVLHTHHFGAMVTNEQDDKRRRHAGRQENAEHSILVQVSDSVAS